jgi:hypothetical protein
LKRALSNSIPSFCGQVISASVRYPEATFAFLTITLKSLLEVVADVTVRFEQDGTGVAVGVDVMVGVLVIVGVSVFVMVSVDVMVGVNVIVAVLVGVKVFVGVGVQVPTKPQSLLLPPPGLGLAGACTTSAILNVSLIPERQEAI